VVTVLVLVLVVLLLVFLLVVIALVLVTALVVTVLVVAVLVVLLVVLLLVAFVALLLLVDLDTDLLVVAAVEEVFGVCASRVRNEQTVSLYPETGDQANSQTYSTSCACFP
jgi:hypothetical protein